VTAPRHDPAMSDREFIAAIREHYAEMAHLVEQEVFIDPTEPHRRTSLRRVLRVEIEAGLKACEARLAKPDTVPK
jgi:hypothetical protein